MGITFPRTDNIIKLISYAQTHHLMPGKWIYAETVIGDWAVQKPQDYLVKISLHLD